MKKALLFFILLTSITLTAQNDPVLIIDNVNITIKAGVSLPYWLKAGQTVDLGPNARSASILEFTIDSNNLIFSQAISLTAAQTVPVNKVWKIEGIGVTTQNTVSPSSIGLSSSGSSSSSTSNLPTIFQSPKKFETPGTYSWTVPPGVTSICVEVWGGGGNGGRCSHSSLPGGGGGGGGAYGYQCFTVVPGTSYNVVVGNSGGTSSVGTLINATGGGSGGDNGGPGGSGGTSSATFNISGTSGGAGAYLYGGFGGNSNDGYGAPSTGTYGYAASGSIPGGGGGGNSNSNPGGGLGAIGKVIIYW